MQRLHFTPVEAAAQIDDDLRQKIAGLPADQRLVFALVYFEELSLDQVAAVIDEPADEVAILFYWAHAGIGTAPLFPPVIEA